MKDMSKTMTHQTNCFNFDNDPPPPFDLHPLCKFKINNVTLELYDWKYHFNLVSDTFWFLISKLKNTTVKYEHNISVYMVYI